MPTSSGQYFLPPVYLATPGEVIRANQHNVPLEDIAQGLSDRMMRDGSTPMLADLPMNGYRIRGVAAATAAGDVPRYDQVTKASAFLNSASDLALAADDLIYAVDASTAGKTTLTAFARTLIAGADAPAMRSTLGLGALATKDQAAIVADTTGTLPVTRGGTGGTTAAGGAAGLQVVSYGAAQTLTAPQQAQARDNIGAADSATAVTGSRTVTAGTGLTGGGDLTADRTLEADFASPAEALAGTATDKVMSPARTMAAIQSKALGEGQAWVDVSASRDHSTWYQNTTGRPIAVTIVALSSSSTLGRVVLLSSDGGTTSMPIGRLSASGSAAVVNSFVLPQGYSYYVDGGISTTFVWAELR